MDPLILLRAAEKYGTPVYVYDENTIRKNFREFLLAFRSRYQKTKIFYSYKANTNLAILHILKQEGAKADVVSGGELKAALRIGLKGEEIIFTNNAKTMDELNMAIDYDVIINIDSIDELYRVYEISKSKGKITPISIRVNPSIDAKTHPKISTGMKESKFGIHIDDNSALKAYRLARDLENINVLGVHMHIGSQITEKSPFIHATERLMEFVKILKDKLNVSLKFVDIGGGLGIKYRNERILTPNELADAVLPIIKKWNKDIGYEPEIWVEPGRYIVGNAGILLCEVQSVKETPYRRFINLNCGFNTLIRPVMYGSYHRIENITKTEINKEVDYDIVGNICESGDIFAKKRKLPKTDAGDIIAIYDVGAYGFSMSSQYNSRPRPAEVLLWEDSAELIRERENYDDLFRHQRVPEDLML